MLKIHWHKPLYVGERVGSRRFSMVQSLRFGRPKRNMYVITPASGGNNLFDIYPAAEMTKSCYRDREFLVVGIGADYDDALELAGRMVGEMYRRTGGFAVADFLKEDR